MAPLSKRKRNVFPKPFLKSKKRLAGCNLEEPIKTDISEDTGINYREPVIGAHESYTGFRYGELNNRDTVKTYAKDSMTLKVVGVEGDTATLLQCRCYAHDTTCTTSALKPDRMPAANASSYPVSIAFWKSSLITSSGRMEDGSCDCKIAKKPSALALNDWW